MVKYHRNAVWAEELGPETVRVPEQVRALARKMPGAPIEEVEAWAKVEPTWWTVRCAPVLRQAGMVPEDAHELYERLGDRVAAHLTSLVDAGRMADIEMKHLRWWAASGLFDESVPGSPNAVQGWIQGRQGYRQPRSTRGASYPSFTRWVSEARRYIAACQGDQQLAAHAAAARLSVDETAAMFTKGELSLETLTVMTAFNESIVFSDRAHNQH